jgi:class 3 adenylate cyclase
MRIQTDSASRTSPQELSFDEKISKIQKYLPKGVTEKILAQKDRIEGERKQVTVMFCDLEGFTHLSEKLGPEDAYAIMDQVRRLPPAQTLPEPLKRSWLPTA